MSTHTFYYWASRLKPALAASPATSRNTPAAVVRFRWRTGAEAWVPADCLAAIRCLAEGLAEAVDPHGGAFQEVVVKP